MIDGLIQIWERELDQANDEVEVFHEYYYESGIYLEGDSERFWEFPEVEKAHERLAIAEETLEQLTKFTS